MSEDKKKRDAEFAKACPETAKMIEQEKVKDIAESKRLFYVATTRAQDYLIISSSKSNKVSQNSWFNYIQKNYEKLAPFIIQNIASD